LYKPITFTRCHNRQDLSMHAAGHVSNPEASENFLDSFQPLAELPSGQLGAGPALTAVSAVSVGSIKTPGFRSCREETAG
jgi:hypothetical protein